jgi:CubicO group peptidase (beta-lactamase class C family)
MKKIILLIYILSLILVSCALEPNSRYVYRSPEKINDGLDVGTLEEVNIDARLIENAVFRIEEGKYKEVHSMLIFKDDKLVLEEYFKGHQYKWDGPKHHGKMVTWNRDMLHMIASDTKSITSTCIGIAIDKGFIESVHQSIFDYLPEHQHLKTDGKEGITIEHLATMTSGLEWDEWGAPLSSPANDVIGLWFNCDDQINCILERPLVNQPGTSFTYSGGNMILLGEIIKNATKMGIDEFSQKYLFDLLRIDSANWSVRYPNGVIESAGGLEITPRAMAKIGVTFLNRGIWNGDQIISEQWVAKSATSYPGNDAINIPGEPSGKNGYSYSWWIKIFSHAGKRINMYSAGGWGGQHIMVLPEFNAVVVFTGGNYVTKRPPFKILEKYIIPALN